MVEGKTADQLGFEGVGQVRPFERHDKVLAERDVGVLGPVVDVLNLTLPIGEPIEETFSPYSFCNWRTLISAFDGC